jgi:filamentous hemagglutinin
VVLGANAGLIGHAATDSLSGNLKVDAGQVSNASNVVASTHGTLDQLAKLANEGGMHGSVDVRVRAADVAQSLDTMMKAVRTRLSVDKSSLTLMGGAVMDAAAPQGGLVQLSAKGLSLDSGASIDATSSRTGAQGGDVLVSAVDGGLLSLNEGATVDAGLGRIVLRANRDDTAADDAPLTDILKIDPVKASLKATEVLVEANRVYEGYTSVKTGSSSGLALGQDDLADDTTTFMGRKDSLLTALGLADQANVHLRSGVEIRSTGDLTINGDWNLWQADRAGGEPIMLTLRAGGNLNVKGSISDGFETTTRASATATEASVMADGAAASLRLVAGADSAAADLLTTHAKEAGGDLVIDAKKMVRTTAGSIELAAANNIELKVQAVTFNTVGKASVVPEQAVVYVAGRPATLADGDTGLASSNVWARYTEGGGRLEAVAGNDIKAPGASQQFGNWLYHASAEDNADATSWWSVLDSFKQGLGSFGGGNIYVQAQGNIVNLGVVSPTSGRNVLSGTGEVALDVRNGGDVTIKAGGDIQGGAFLLGRGEGRIEAGGAIVAGSNLNTKVAGVGAILGLMDGHWLLQARGDVLLAGAYNPTALTSPATRVPDSDAYLFFTYSPDASLSLSSAAGDVTWKTGSLLDYYGTYLTKVIVSLSAPVESSPISGDATNALLQAAPPIVRLAAMQGNATIDITKAANLTLFPSDQGDLSIFAGQDVQLQSHGNGGLVMADGDASRWPSVSHPVQERASASTLIENLNLPELFPSAPVVTAELLTSSTLHADDTVPARVFAGEDIAFSAGDSANSLTQFNLAIPKQATLEATGDILNPQYTGEHFHDSDVTLIKAGGNVVGSTAATDNRSIGYIQLLGAGELQIEAGRRLDLRTSAGVQTLGNFNKDALGVAKNGNSALGDESASIRISASMNKALELDKFASLYLNNNPQAQAELVAYVKQTLKLGQGALPDDVQTAYPQALALFAGFSKAHQVSFAQGLLDRAFVARYVAPGQAYAQSWQDFAASKGANASDLQSAVFGEFKDEVVMAEVRRLGSQAVDLADSTDPGLNAQRQAQRDALWAQVDAMSSLAGLGQGFSFLGDVDLGGSKVHTLGTGNFTQGGIDFFVPGGGVLVGYNAALTAEKASNVARKRGVVTYDGGSIRSFTESDFQVNTQKAFVVGTGDVVVYSRSGDIDSGRGSNTDVTVPPPEAITDPDTGNIVFVSPAVTKGSGIGLLKNAQGGATGTIELYTPKGTVRALDTFITSESGGEIRVAGTILGADNLKGAVKGGAPAVAGPTLKVGTTLPGDTAAGIEAVTAASQSGQRKEANGILTVELLNLGDGSDGGTAPAAGTKKPCKPDDKDCNKP